MSTNWDITLVSVNFYAGPVYLYAWNPKDTVIVRTHDFTSHGGETISLYKVLPEGGRQLLWVVDPHVNGTGLGDTTGATYFGEFALGDHLQLEVAVPEPTGILALASGLFGFAGLALRRRK